MTIFGCVVRWLRGRPVWAGNLHDPGDTNGTHHAFENSKLSMTFGPCMIVSDAI